MSKASAYFTLGSIDGRHAVKELRNGLDTLPGVLSVSVNDSSRRVAVDFDTTGTKKESICKKIEEMGFEVLNSELEKHIMQEAGRCRKRTSLQKQRK